MTIRHHPDETLLMGLAAGRLAPGPALVVRAHLDLCPQCRRDAEALEAAGGALLDALPPTMLGDEALARALARIETPETRAPASSRQQGGKRRIGFGLWYAPLYWDRASGARAYELHVPAGMHMPVHTHRGVELTCIVQGSFEDETGRFETGDFIAVDESLHHSPHAGPEGECVCIIACDGPLKMQSLVARAVQSVLQL